MIIILILLLLLQDDDDDDDDDENWLEYSDENAVDILCLQGKKEK